MGLAIDRLSVMRGGRLVVDGLSLVAAAGEAVVLTGRNGAGKTTLLRAIAGLLQPEAGTVVLSPPTGTADDTVAERCHFIGHLDGVKAALTVEENARFAADWLGGGRDPIDAALDRVGLGGLGPVAGRFLSAGQRRRLALCRLLVAPRPVWLLDEPTASLDAAGHAMLASVAAGHLAGGGIVIAATHVPLGIAGARMLPLGSDAGGNPEVA